MIGEPKGQEQKELQSPDGFRFSISRTLTLGLSFLILASIGTSLWFAIDAAQKNTTPVLGAFQILGSLLNAHATSNFAHGSETR